MHIIQLITMLTDRFLVYLPNDSLEPRCILADNIDYLVFYEANKSCGFVTDCGKAGSGLVKCLSIDEVRHVSIVSSIGIIAAKKETVISVKLCDDCVIMHLIRRPEGVPVKLPSCRDASILFERIKEAYAGETKPDGSYMLYQDAPGS